MPHHRHRPGARRAEPALTDHGHLVAPRGRGGEHRLAGGRSALPEGFSAAADGWGSHRGNPGDESTGNESIGGSTADGAHGDGPGGRRGDPARPVVQLSGSAYFPPLLWVYTDFHCTLACDYCPVASSPHAAPRAMLTGQVPRACR